MNKYDEILTEIDGKIGYADATGNQKAKDELADIRKCISNLKECKDNESLCVTCCKGNDITAYGMGCGMIPNFVFNKKVGVCSGYCKKERK